MQRKINEAFLQDYCNQFCDEVSERFFASKEVINGKDILTLCPSKQVNFFILKALFTSWQEEMKRLESPYFNFKDVEVRNAMVSFMNVLSQKIEIRQADFNPLLVSAVYETIHILSNPAAYTTSEFSQRGLDQVSEKMLKTYLKYIKVYREEFEEALSGIENISLDDLSDLLRDHFEEVDPEEELRNHLDILAEVVPISIADLFEKEADEEEPPFLPDLEEPFEEEEPIFDAEVEDEPKTYDSEVADDSDDRFIENQTEESEATQALAYREESDFEDTLEEDFDADDTEETKTEEEKDADAEIEEDQPVESDDMEALNDRFEKPHQLPVAEKQTKIASIMDAIIPSNRYLFVKSLFDGDQDAFTETIEQIESCDSFDEAVEMIVHEHAKLRNWDMNSDEVKELLKVVFRRFR